LAALEPSFHQDLNGDGVIGVPGGAAVGTPGGTVIEAIGSTSLVQVGSNYFLDSISSGTGPELKLNGANFVAGQSSDWVPIGVEQTSTGFEIAWKFTGSDQYTIWNTDSSGNYVSSPIGVVSGASSALTSLEPSFHQDLNGDGVIGVPGGAAVRTGGTVIEAIGSTSLVQVGSNYFLDSISSGTGPELKLNGANFVAGQSSDWVPIGVEQISTGYEVAWKFTGSDQYTIWNTDSSGNYVSSPIGVVSGASSALAALEPTFHQDLNGSGTIGIPPAATPANTIQEASNLAPHSPWSMAARSDTFVFNAAVPNGEASEAITTVAPQPDRNLFGVTSSDHNEAFNPDGHEGTNLTNIQIFDLHHGSFLIH
jgi:serralysin